MITPREALATAATAGFFLWAAALVALILPFALATELARALVARWTRASAAGAALEQPIRVPMGTRLRLMQAAGVSGRSAEAELVDRLESTFRVDDWRE